MAKILLVEDDVELAQVIKRWLTNERHTCEHVDDGQQATLCLERFSYELIILDLGLPEVHGLEVLNQHRLKGGKTPVLILTGKSALDDKLTGFQAGADDYLTKPLDGRELTARVSALLRRPADLHSDNLTVGDLELIPSLHLVKRNGENIQLVPREYALLQFLMRYPNQLFKPDRLLDIVWANDADSSYEALTTCVKRLRKKLDRMNEPSVIRNVHGVGYGLFPDRDAP
ncbi:MAG: response regulator transcription factor [Candidatus Obscuribacterales bacterium]